LNTPLTASVSIFLSYLSSSSLDKVKQSNKPGKNAQNTVKPSEFVVFYFVLILLGFGNPHRYLQFGKVAIKTSNFLPEFGPDEYTNFLNI
jgi:hypothetical protein